MRMRSSKTNIVISSLMILVFTAFNVGTPIVTYLCPMMSMENPHCEMMPPATHGVLSFTSEMPDCCTSHIVAERNTTPYLSVEQFKISHLVPLDQVALAANDTYLAHGQSSSTEVLCISASPPFRETVSLSLLNSTLLI
jgi:hypothetical protein